MKVHFYIEKSHTITFGAIEVIFATHGMERGRDEDECVSLRMNRSERQEM